jgi:hypothetical protein
MSTDIKRLLYHERQHLGSFDFTAEQRYHLEMRRRLNLTLHHWGIVEGLELLQGELVPGAPEEAQKEVYVSGGMAVDAYGREIIVPATHRLAEDLGNNQITATGAYSVWIGYIREPSTPPQAGYEQCELPNEYTRWREYFAIYLFKAGIGGPTFQEDPGPFDALPDDPKKYPWLIHLGTISVDNNFTIINPANEGRLYVGVRAQRIVTPRDGAQEFAVLAKNNPLSPATSVGVEANLFTEQNLIVGDDFEVKTTGIFPPPVPKGYPSPTGNVKVASDLFVQGDLYTRCDSTQTGHWLNLDQCIRQRIKDTVPETQIGTTDTVPFEATRDASKTFVATVDLAVTTQLAQVATKPPPHIITSIASVSFKAPRQVNTGETGMAATRAARQERASIIGNGLQIETFGKVSPPSGDQGNQYILSLTCTIGPLPDLNPDNFPVDSVKISYVVIFYPKT